MNDDQRWRDAHPWEADDEPVGVVYNEKRHRWAHPWSEYLVIMVGFLGAIAVIGAVQPFSVVRLLGAVMILGGSFSFSRSDRAHRTSPRNERIWALAAVLLTLGGLAVFFLSW
jgi:hypothetical protein